ncbi:MAG: pyridoxamine 5'-phosphate oxidase [Legionella sp.]
MLSDIRRDYGRLTLSDHDVLSSPFDQFDHWFKQVLQTDNLDPTAMVLSTVDEHGLPDSRVVLLKSVDHNNFVFYTNYQSHKALQLEKTPYAALNFFWPQLARQIRIRGHVKKTSIQQSDDYFLSRPLMSQLSAMASPQSQVINNQEELNQRLETLFRLYQKQPIVRPENWGGYILSPQEFEFWQGRDNRLHDRVHYYLDGMNWMHCRLAP